MKNAAVPPSGVARAAWNKLGPAERLAILTSLPSDKAAPSLQGQTGVDVTPQGGLKRKRQRRRAEDIRAALAERGQAQGSPKSQRDVSITTSQKGDRPPGSPPPSSPPGTGFPHKEGGPVEGPAAQTPKLLMHPDHLRLSLGGSVARAALLGLGDSVPAVGLVRGLVSGLMHHKKKAALKAGTAGPSMPAPKKKTVPPAPVSSATSTSTARKELAAKKVGQTAGQKRAIIKGLMDEMAGK